MPPRSNCRVIVSLSATFKTRCLRERRCDNLDGSANLYHVDGVLVKFHYLLNLPVCPQVRFKVLMAPARLVPSASELNLTVIVNRLAAAFDTLVFKTKIAIYGIITIDDIMNRISPSTIVMVRTIMFLTKGL